VVGGQPYLEPLAVTTLDKILEEPVLDPGVQIG
jgi:hypothetical protein